MTDTPAQRKQRILTSDKVKVDSPAARIVDKAGGLSRFCEMTGFAVATVHSWLTRNGSIPNKQRDGMSYQALIMQRLGERGIHLDPAEFLDLSAHG